MHTNETPNYHLPQFLASDKATWLGDINTAFATIDTGMYENKQGQVDFNNNIETLTTKVDAQQESIETLSALAEGIDSEIKIEIINTLALSGFTSIVNNTKLIHYEYKTHDIYELVGSLMGNQVNLTSGLELLSADIPFNINNAIVKPVALYFPYVNASSQVETTINYTTAGKVRLLIVDQGTYPSFNYPVDFKWVVPK